MPRQDVRRQVYYKVRMGFSKFKSIIVVFASALALLDRDNVDFALCERELPVLLLDHFTDDPVLS